MCIGEYPLEFNRHVSRKGRQHRLHIESPFTREYFLLQFLLPVQPLFRQRTVPAIYVCHSMPWQIGRPRKIASYLVVGHTEFLPYIVPHGFLSRNCQWHVDSIEGHPVDEWFPFFPTEEGYRISVSAIIEEKAYSWQILLKTGGYEEKIL